MVDRGDVVVPAALWCETGTVPLHLTRQRPCSSVYPPDMRVLSAFVDILGVRAREVDQRIDVPATTIDEELPRLGLDQPDFIKLDIHSAEYEALAGARRALSESVVGVLVEAWPVAIHAGQHSYAELDTLLQGTGFCPFETSVGRWPHRLTSSTRYASQPQSVQFEILYLFDATGDRVTRLSVERLLMLLVFAELFGFVSYAMLVLGAAVDHGVMGRASADRLCRTLVEGNRVPGWQWHLSRAARRAQRGLDRLIVPIADG